MIRNLISFDSSNQLSTIICGKDLLRSVGTGPISVYFIQYFTNYLMCFFTLVFLIFGTYFA